MLKFDKYTCNRMPDPIRASLMMLIERRSPATEIRSFMAKFGYTPEEVTYLNPHALVEAEQKFANSDSMEQAIFVYVGEEGNR